MIALLYRTADLLRWGLGLGRRLTNVEVDTNIFNLGQAIVDLQTSRPQPNNISAITAGDNGWTITLQDGTTIGPIPVQTLMFRFMGAWVPFAVYSVMDVFTVEGFGLYVTLLTHTAGAEFDPAIAVGGAPALQQLMGTDAGSAAAAAIYDMGFFYPGRLTDISSGVAYEVVLVRPIVMPAAGAHQAYIRTPSSTVTLVLPIFHNATQIGTVTLAPGSQVGAVAITADEAIAAGDVFWVGAVTADGTAAGLSVSFAAQRVLAA